MIFFALYVTTSLYLYQQWMPRLVARYEPTPVPLDAIPPLAGMVFAVAVAIGLS